MSKEDFSEDWYDESDESSEGRRDSRSEPIVLGKPSEFAFVYITTEIITLEDNPKRPSNSAKPSELIAECIMSVTEVGAAYAGPVGVLEVGTNTGMPWPYVFVLALVTCLVPISYMLFRRLRGKCRH